MMIEIPVSVIDTVEKLKNIMLTHIGWNTIKIMNMCNPTTFHPHMIILFYKNEQREYYDFPLELTQHEDVNFVIGLDGSVKMKVDNVV